MESQKQKQTFKKHSLRQQIATVVLLLSSGCAHITIPETVSNAEWCHPFKNSQGIDIGASCDDLLVSNPQTLNESQWVEKQSNWLSSGSVVECTPSKSMIDIKVFIEDTCSQITCDQKTKDLLVSRLDAIARLGQ